MTTKDYLLSLLICLCYTISWSQIAPYPNNSLEEELEIRTMGPPSIPLACDITTLDFQEVLVGESLTRQYRIGNIGNDVLYIDDIEIVGSSDFSFTSNLNSPTGENIILPGQQGSLFITFSPTSTGEKNAQIIIRSSDADEGVCGLALEGDGYIPIPGTLRIRREGFSYAAPCDAGLTSEFPDIIVGESHTRTYFLENIGDEPLIFYGMILSGSTDFSLVYNFPYSNEPIPIPAGSNLSYDITFTPSSPGEKDASYIINTSDQGKDECSIMLEGGGLKIKSPHLAISDSNGNSVPCGGTIHIDLSATNPHPVIFGFYFTFRNYGTSDLSVGGTVSIQGVPGSSQSIDYFSMETLEWNFLNTTVYLPGHQITTLVYTFNTNDPNQPFCTIYVEINQIHKHGPGPYPGPVDTKRKATIQSVVLDKNNGKSMTSSSLATQAYETAETTIQQEAPRLYPTASQDQITLEVNSNERKNYWIVDMKGQVIRSGHTQGDKKTRVEIESLASGLYLIRLEGHPKPLRFVKR